MTKLNQLVELGQSIWLDYIRRSFITSGELAGLVAQGLRGVTSNPSIFEKAIAGSTDYDPDLHRLVDAGLNVEEIYEALVVEDIRRAADVLLSVFEETQGKDGYVSLEVSPRLAHDTAGTIAEARRLYQRLDRPNVMIKVPATKEGIPAIQALIGEGLNINVTLLFSLAQYEAVVEAYMAGLESLAANGGDLRSVASVASFFVSRVDTQVNRHLTQVATDYPEVQDLFGQIAIANAKIAYQAFEKIFDSPRWATLASRGARVQRVLWASTSAKDPTLPDTIYVDRLIGPHTVNTVPPSTLTAFLDHGTLARTVDDFPWKAQAQLDELEDYGIDLEAITDRLLEDGVASFAASFDTLMSSIAEKRERLLSGWSHMEAALGEYQNLVDSAMEQIEAQKIISRIWAHDHTVWRADPEEITNRLGWLHSPEVMGAHLERLEELRAGAVEDGFKHVMLLGMGGSSLAPEVFQRTFGVGHGGLGLDVLDSTSPDAVLKFTTGLDLARTLFIVATKSGGTVETVSFFKYFYNLVQDQGGEPQPGAHFIAITDPGSGLAALAERYQFRAVFLNDPNIGGRYSALSYFGLVPAALIGMDVGRFLRRAQAMACGSESCVDVWDNPGAQLGAILGELAKVGRDKVTLVLSPPIASFGDWIEQLIAESTGKDGTGILPVVGERLAGPHAYASDRVFVQMRLKGDTSLDSSLAALEKAGHPVIRLHLHDPYDLGGQIFLWELATVVAGGRLGIHPFDQPNVESAKVRAREMVATFQESGRLPSLTPALEESGGITVYGQTDAANPGQALVSFLDQAYTGEEGPRSYVALQAYLPPEEKFRAALQDLRTAIQVQHQIATTLGFGPRFLHSTGQLHKGDHGRGLFIQFTARHAHDVPIPDVAGLSDSVLGFGPLIDAQALGDRQALLDNGRAVIRFDLGGDILGGLRVLRQALG